jgi:hypothetical protein
MAGVADIIVGMLETSQKVITRIAKSSYKDDIDQACEAIAKSPTCHLPASPAEVAEAEKHRRLQGQQLAKFRSKQQIKEQRSLRRAAAAGVVKRRSSIQKSSDGLLSTDNTELPPVVVFRACEYGTLPWAGLKLLLKFLQRYARYKSGIMTARGDP